MFGGVLGSILGVFGGYLGGYVRGCLGVFWRYFCGIWGGFQMVNIKEAYDEKQRINDMF